MIEPVKKLQLTGEQMISISAVKLIFNELIEAHNALEAEYRAHQHRLPANPALAVGVEQPDGTVLYNYPTTTPPVEKK